MKNNSRSGFTIIEMLVVIAIIGILSAIIITNLTSSKAKARDAKRVSDLAQIQLALEQCFDRGNVYPSNLITTVPCGGTLTLADFISTIPKDPTTLSDYGYAIMAGGLDYTLHAKLENPSSVIKDGLISAPNYVGTSFSCSNADGSLDYCIGPK